MANLFAKLGFEAFRAGIQPRSEESRKWFRKRVQDMRSINRDSLLKDESLEKGNTNLVGSMNMFFYDPKTKDTLPFYDTFPLVIIVGPAQGGFYGINLHYLPMNLRAKFLDGLLDNLNNKRYDESTRFKINYNMLRRASKLKYFKPCFKHYLTEHVSGRISRVPSSEWEIATFLPTANFEKGSNETVYRFSRSMI